MRSKWKYIPYSEALEEPAKGPEGIGRSGVGGHALPDRESTESVCVKQGEQDERFAENEKTKSELAAPDPFGGIIGGAAQFAAYGQPGC